MTSEALDVTVLIRADHAKVAALFEALDSPTAERAECSAR